MQTQLAKFKANLEGLAKLSGDQLIEGAISYGVEDDTIKMFVDSWKRDRVDYERLTTAGFGKDHPKVRALASSIKKQGKILREAAENYKSTLGLNIQNIEAALASVKDEAAATKTENLNEKVNSAEYMRAKQEWEQKLEVLGRLEQTRHAMEIRQFGKKEELLLLLTPDELAMASVSCVMPPFPELEGQNNANHGSAVKPELSGSGKPEMETRTFRVPPGFLRAELAGPRAEFAKERPPTVQSALSALGFHFEEGATVDLDKKSGVLTVHNTPDQMAGIQALLSDYSRVVGRPDSKAGASVSAADREGILPLNFALPEGGRMYRFDGQYPPGTLTFRYESWQRQVRWSWLWIGLGALGFRLLGWRSPWFVGLVGALLLQFGPGVLGRPGWLPLTNALVIGWLLAAALRVVFGRLLRPRRQAAAAPPPSAGILPSAQVLSLLSIASILSMGSILMPGSTARAQEPAPAPAAAPAAEAPVPSQAAAAAAEPPIVVIPFDPDQPLDPQSPEKRYLDYATFERMWAAAKANRRQEAAGQAAAPASGERAAVLTSALHRAEAAGQVLRVESVYALLTRGPEWVGVPFGLENGLKSLTLDGAPAALRDGELLVEKAGAHQVTASYEVPLTPGWQEVAWKVPAATASSLALSLAMDDPARPVINGGAPLVETEAGGRRVFTATLGAGADISLKRQTAARRAGAQAAEPSLAKVDTRMFLSPALERVEASISYTFAGQDRSEFSLRLDPGLTPVSFSVPGLENWTLRREADAQVLDFRLGRPVREFFSLRLVAERPAGALPLTESAPLLSAAAARVERGWSVLATNDLEVRPLLNDGLHRVEFEKTENGEETGFDAVGSWQAAGNAEPLRWELRPRVPEASAVVRYALQPGAGKLELSAGIELHPAADRELRDLTIQVPEGSTVQGVSGDRLADWWHEGTALHARFERSGGGGGDAVTRLALNLTRPLAAGAVDFAFRPLVIEGFSKVSGSGLLIAPVNQETTLALTPAAPALREVAPEETATGFTIRPPFESKRGFVFSGSDWTATASLKPLPERYDVDWVMDAELRDSWVELNTRVLLALTRGGLERIEFTTPASAPEFRVTGGGLRETVSAVEGNVRRYTVSFQALRTGTVLFTLTGQMPLGTPAADGGPGLPDIDFAGAARVSRFVIVDNKSAGEMRLRPSGMDITPREQVSLLPAELVSGQTAAQFYRARPGWSMGVAVEKLETSAGQSAVVLQADLTTSLLRNGDVWQRAVYVLENRSLQFLPVHLPEGAEVISVVVGSEATRADSGVVNGLPVLLVPLIQTAPGELAMEVKLIYRLRGKAKAGEFPENLDDPELPGLSVGQTFWTVQYPDGFTLEPRGGNMTRVEDRELSGEKAESRLTEINSLRSIADSDNYDPATRERARGNVRKLAAAWRELLPTGRGEDYPQILKDTDRERIPAAEESRSPARGAEDAYRVKEFVDNKTSERKPESSALKPGEADAGTAGDMLNLNDNVSWAFKNQIQTQTGTQTQTRGAELDKITTGPARNQRRLSQITRLQGLGGGAGGANPAVSDMSKTGSGSISEGEKDSTFASGSIEQKLTRDKSAPDQRQQDFDDLNRNYSFGNARLSNNWQTATAATKAQAASDSKKSDARREAPQEPAAANGPAGSAAPQPQTATPPGQPATGSRRDAGDGAGLNDGLLKVTADEKDASQARLRTTGRVSLDAVFPAQTQEMHFRKMKGNASLRLRVGQADARGIHWIQALVLTVVLAGLWGLRATFRVRH